MSVSYKKLFDIIKENNISRSRLRAMTGIGEATISKLQHNMNVNVDVIERICVEMKCQPSDIMEVEMKEE